MLVFLWPNSFTNNRQNEKYSSPKQDGIFGAGALIARCVFVLTKTNLAQSLGALGDENFATQFSNIRNMESMKKRIWFRMTDEEKSRLQEMASNSGRTVSGYIRAKQFGGERATINAVEFLKEYKTQIHEMQKIGNNINQLAHYANICIKSGVVSEAVVQEMNQTIGELTKIEIKLEDIMRRIVKG